MGKALSGELSCPFDRFCYLFMLFIYFFFIYLFIYLFIYFFFFLTMWVKLLKNDNKYNK